MNVIAIYSSPQEYGDDSLRFVSCADGQVILDLNLTMEEDPIVEKTTREIVSEIGTFYDLCAKQRYEVFDVEDRIPYTMGAFADMECTIPLDKKESGFWETHKEDYLTILSCKKGKRIHTCWWGDLDKQEIKAYSWKYTVAKTKKTTEYIYHPELDTVYQELKEKCGLLCPPEDRYDIQTLALRISEALGYKMLNLIYG